MVEILDLIRNIGPHPLSGSKGDGCLHVTKVMPLFFFFKVSLMFSKLAFMLLVVSKSLLSLLLGMTYLCVNLGPQLGVWI